jgi:predicted nicotinamide N-methyase
MSTPPIETLGYPLLTRSIKVGGETYTLRGPANYEQLIDEPSVAERFARDEYLPYWAEFWPAAVLLAEEVAGWEPAAASGPPTVLELGCGLGLISIVAARRGYRVIATDYDEHSLAFAAENARANDVTMETRCVDWRERYDDLRIDRIVAAEITYERRHLAPIAAFLRTHLTPGGKAVICDRNRQVADGFAQVVRENGLDVREDSVSGRDGAGQELSARIFRIEKQL